MPRARSLATAGPFPGRLDISPVEPLTLVDFTPSGSGVSDIPPLQKAVVLPQLSSLATTHAAGPSDGLDLVMRFDLADAAEVAVGVAEIQAIEWHLTPSACASNLLIEREESGLIWGLACHDPAGTA